jgi:hypothetical protein
LVIEQVSQKTRIFWQNPRFLLFFSGSCSETEVSEQLYFLTKKIVKLRSPRQQRPRHAEELYRFHVELKLKQPFDNRHVRS